MIKKINLSVQKIILSLTLALISTNLLISSTPPPSILFVQLANGWSGVPQSTASLYKALLHDGYPVHFLLAKGSITQKLFALEQVPYFSCKNTQPETVYKAVDTLCSQRKFDIIHLNWPEHLAPIVSEAAKKYGAKTLLTCHFSVIPPRDNLSPCDFISAVNLNQIETIVAMDQHRNKKTIFFTPPVYDETRFINFYPQYGRKEFFKKFFGRTVTDDTLVISTIAVLFPGKNHVCLMRAVQQIKHTMNRNVKLIFAGDGPLKKQLLAFGKELGIDKNIHFLGHTDKIPEILYYSDINVLPSRMESFGIAIIEAALMRKPIIISNAIPAANMIIINEKTGLLFKDNDHNDLAVQLKRFIENHEFGRRMGQNAYEHVLRNFASRVSVERYKEVFNAIGGSS